MAHAYFHPHHKELLQEAVVIAEEVTSEFFKLTQGHWLKARYDILTLEALQQEEISPHALALVAKYGGQPQGRHLPSTFFDFYRICLQDHNILKALETGGELRLFPLLVYVLTHELVHIVRFSQYLARFEASPEEKRQEEEQVHRLTQRILAPLNFIALPPGIGYIL
ncbi:MAG: hypothetical protein Q8M54_09710 [Desulfobaccales bacterium]|nr:hypothetical protein [Desulfobaccales bacterium]